MNADGKLIDWPALESVIKGKLAASAKRARKLKALDKMTSDNSDDDMVLSGDDGDEKEGAHQGNKHPAPQRVQY
jgi:hypothetical protein